MEIKKYDSTLKEVWNKFIEESRNGTFLLNRNFMEYHSDRFTDHSLLFYEKDKLIAVLPANIKENILHSHQGLTYGGIIQAEKTSIDQIRQVVELLIEHLKNEKIEKFIYKPVPHIYHRYPAEEDLYALFHAGATLKNRSISSTILLEQKIEFNRLRKRSIKKAMTLRLKATESKDFEGFWTILTDNLRNTHNAQPTHSLEEIKFLHSCFPKQIRLFSLLTTDGEMVAGMVVFDIGEVIHVQYSSANVYGKQNGGLDTLYNFVINNIFVDNQIFDFGTSTEDEGRFLNEGLILQKESFGGRATVCDTYELIIK